MTDYAKREYVNISDKENQSATCVSETHKSIKKNYAKLRLFKTITW